MVFGNLLFVLLKLLLVTIQHDPAHVHTTQYCHATVTLLAKLSLPMSS